MKKYPYLLKWVNVVFEFESIGRKGLIKKIIEYQTRTFLGEDVVNLALGDWNEERRYAEDDITSNNGDTNMVLATVASTCVEMMSLHPTIRVLAEGATPARNRLYQIGIVKNWSEIELTADVDGLRFGKWEPFQPNVGYSAFRAKRKQK
ncbi:MAG TPA: hypothetical protein VK508_07730 [Cyclobacteriaceae bacterium]|nr:hypothetical protein [Cyclobacteriaceae bacterium]